MIAKVRLRCLRMQQPKKAQEKPPKFFSLRRKTFPGLCRLLPAGLDSESLGDALDDGGNLDGLENLFLGEASFF